MKHSVLVNILLICLSVEIVASQQSRLSTRGLHFEQYPLRVALSPRADDNRRTTRAMSRAAALAAQQNPVPARSAWSETSDSSSGSLSSGNSYQGGPDSKTTVWAQGRTIVTHKRKGTDEPQVIRTTNPKGYFYAFTGAEKARTKVKVLDNKSLAHIDIEGGKARMKGNTKDNHGPGADVGIKVGNRDALVTDIPPNSKGTHTQKSTPRWEKATAALAGKGTIRGKIAPKPHP